MAAINWNLAGNSARCAALEIVTVPDSMGSRKASNALRGNSGSSSRKRTPWCARLTSPGRGKSAPPPTSPTSLTVWCGERNGRVRATPLDGVAGAPPAGGEGDGAKVAAAAVAARAGGVFPGITALAFANEAASSADVFAVGTEAGAVFLCSTASGGVRCGGRAAAAGGAETLRGAPPPP